MNFAVEAESLSKDHAGEGALKGISFRVPAASLFGIIGADGAGKSTLMNILATLIDPDGGSAKVLGSDMASGMRAIRRDIGYMPQKFSLYQDLSVHENLDFFADIFGLTPVEKAERMAALLDFAALKPFTARRAGRLSGGMKQKLALACTLIHRPRLLLLDEPTVGVDPVARRDFWTLLKALKSQGIALIVSTPYMDEAARCDELIFLHEGRILAQGTPQRLLESYPYRLYRVEGPGTLHYPASKPPPPGFALIYPSAGSLHAAEAAPNAASASPAVGASPTGNSRADVLERLRMAVPEALSAEPIAPSVEDYFFALLSGRGATTEGGR